MDVINITQHSEMIGEYEHIYFIVHAEFDIKCESTDFLKVCEALENKGYICHGMCFEKKDEKKVDID